MCSVLEAGNQGYAVSIHDSHRSSWISSMQSAGWLSDEKPAVFKIGIDCGFKTTELGLIMLNFIRSKTKF